MRKFFNIKAHITPQVELLDVVSGERKFGITFVVKYLPSNTKAFAFLVVLSFVKTFLFGFTLCWNEKCVLY